MTGSGLLTAAGQELLARLSGEDLDPGRALALSASLRPAYPADLVAEAMTQQALRIAARAKFGAAAAMLFTRAGLEQASSDLTARHAARRFAGASVVADLCCGIGGNLVALATLDRPPAVVAVDTDPLALEFARHNVSVCAPAARAAFVRADVRQLRLTGFGAAFIDPARRDQRGRLPSGQYLPPLDWALRLPGAVPAVGIKAAPGISRDLVPPGWEIEFVAVGRDLKEALLWSPALATAGGAAHISGRAQSGRHLDAGPGAAASESAGWRSRATILPGGDSLTASAASGLPVPVAPPGAYLLDPSPAVTRAGLVGELAHATGAWQIDPMIAFLSSDAPIRTPFARTLRVVESAPWHERRFARRLAELGIGAADIRRRGLAGDVRQIHRRLGLRGDGAATVVLTRVRDQPWGLICQPDRASLTVPAGCTIPALTRIPYFTDSDD